MYRGSSKAVILKTVVLFIFQVNGSLVVWTGLMTEIGMMTGTVAEVDATTDVDTRANSMAATQTMVLPLVGQTPHPEVGTNHHQLENQAQNQRNPQTLC